MQRVLILGSGGSGKSTLARRLGERCGLPVEHLDRHSWLPGWVEVDRDKFPEIVERLIAAERWVIDGNYSATLERRLSRADTVVFLDFPRTFCVQMALKRYWQNRGRTRPDMTEGCPEKIDLEFVSWIWDYPKRSRPRVLRMLADWTGQDSTRTLLHFRRRREVEAWLKELG